nr:hypothetical protein [Kibdelosporangium sp. MJ126-NF4]
MVIEQHAWANGEFWTGNIDANALTGVAKPRVLGHWDWIDGPGRCAPR